MRFLLNERPLFLFLYPLVSELSGQLEPIPAVHRRRQGDILDKLLAHHRASWRQTTNYTEGQFRVFY